MDPFDLIKALCKQCGSPVEFISRGIAPEGRDYDIESPDTPYDVIENTTRDVMTCPHCMAQLRFRSSISAWVEIVND